MRTVGFSASTRSILRWSLPTTRTPGNAFTAEHVNTGCSLSTPKGSTG